MKRPQVNEIVGQADRFIGSFGCRLPPHAYLSAREPADRFSTIVKDEQPLHLPVSDCEGWLQAS